MNDYKGNPLAPGDAVVVATCIGIKKALVDGIVEETHNYMEEFLGKYGLHETAIIKLSDGSRYHMSKFEEKSVMKKGNE